MIKKYRKTLIITSVIILLPMVAGVIMWQWLRETMATHFGTENLPDGWNSKEFTVLGMPAILLALQWLCVLVSSADPKRKNTEGKLFSLVLWIVPVLSLFCGGIIYAFALGVQVNVGFLAVLLMGVMLVVMGNYLPKCRQNNTMGIKLPWTLKDEENWNRTHRMAGRLWMVCGLAAIVMAFIQPVLFGIAVVVAVAVPTVYSYALHRKKRKGGN